MTEQDVHALVLSGGGAKGAYEVGVMKALFEEAGGVEPSVFTGTSVGSFNAAFMVSHADESSSAAVAELENVWLRKIASNGDRGGNGVFRFRADPFRLLNPFAADPLQNLRELAGDSAFFADDWSKRVSHFISASEPFSRRAVELVDLSSFVSTEPLNRLIRDTIEVGKVLSSQRALRIATTCWETGELRVYRNDRTLRPQRRYDYERDLDKGNTHLAVAASAAIPGLFSPVRIGSENYVDGGVVMNTPLRSAIRAGAGTLHVVYLDPEAEDLEASHLPNTLDTMNRLFIQLMAVNTSRDIEEVERINRMLSVREQLEAAEKHLAEREENQPGGPGSDDPVAGLASTMSRQPLRQIREGLEQELDVQHRKLEILTVHRYRPRKPLGGLLGLLDFRKDRISRLIETGYLETKDHSCSESGCVIPKIEGAS